MSSLSLQKLILWPQRNVSYLKNRYLCLYKEHNIGVYGWIKEQLLLMACPVFLYRWVFYEACVCWPVYLYSFHPHFFTSLSDNERDTGAQNKNLRIPRHRRWRRQQTHPKDQGNQKCSCNTSSLLTILSIYLSINGITNKFQLIWLCKMFFLSQDGSCFFFCFFFKVLLLILIYINQMRAECKA